MDPAQGVSESVTKGNEGDRPARDGNGALGFALLAARALSDDKCRDVRVLEVRGLSPITDYLIIASGTSDRQMRSSLIHLEEMAEEMGGGAIRSNSDENASWLLADFVDVVVHLFEPNARAHYDLERMWPNAKVIDWEAAQGGGEGSA